MYGLNQYTLAAPSIKSIEMDLMGTQGLDDDLQGSATWITHGFSTEEAQIALKLDAHQMGLQDMESSGWNGDIQRTANDDSQDVDQTFTEIYPTNPEGMGLPLPLYLGSDMCQDLWLQVLQNHKLQLWQGQANDVLHELQLALVDKSQLFCTDVRHSHNYNMTSHPWKKVTTVVADPNAHGHCNEHLAWFGPWISQRIPIQMIGCLNAKLLKDQWAEEMELLSCKGDWT
ncbi:hypothetical protein J3A83DRAFT_4188409 [Scleroderma citrinum]